MTRLTTNSFIFILGDLYFIVQCGIATYFGLVEWGENRCCLENTKWGQFDKSIILSDIRSYWSEPEEALGIRIELIQASITEEIQGHIKVRQAQQKNNVDKSRRQS